MTSFEGSVIVLLLVIAVGIVWIGMRQDNKLYFIHDRLGILLDFAQKIGCYEEKISNIEKNTYGTFDAVDMIHRNTCSIILRMPQIREEEPLDKPFEPVSREELVKKYGNILAGHVDVYTDPQAMDVLGIFINAIADLGWLDILNRHEPKAVAANSVSTSEGRTDVTEKLPEGSVVMQ